MAGDYLPPVVTELTAEIGDVLAKVEEVKAAIKSIGSVDIPVDFDTNTLMVIEELEAIKAELRDISADEISQTEILSAMTVPLGVIRRDIGDISADLMVQTALLGEIRDELIGAAGAAELYGGAMERATAQTAAGSRTWRIWGANAATVIHWIISGTAELLAVLVPATVAAAAWAFVWVQGATNVYEHLNALFTATEALGQAAGQTFGEMLGLKGAFQAAQNAANPDVYQALGGVLNILKEQFGNLASVGLHMGLVFDAFMGRLVYDFSAAGGAGATMNSILHAMVPDLIEIGQLFGNLGRFVADVAAQMPGLAEVLLFTISRFVGLAAAVTEFLGHFELFGWSLLTGVMAVEEFMRWGGLLVSLFNKMGLTSMVMGEKFLTTERFTAVFMGLFTALPNLVGGAIERFGEFVMTLGAVDGAVNAAGQEVLMMGQELKDGADGLELWQAMLVTAAAIGLGILIDKLVTARSVAQRFGDALQQAAEKANDMDILPVIASNMSKLQAQMNSTSDAMHQLAVAGANMSGSLESTTKFATAAQQENAGLTDSYNNLRGAYDQYAASQVQQIHDFSQVMTGAGQLQKMYGVSFPAALALAQSANVNLTKSLENSKGQLTAAGQQIHNYVAGLGAMGTASGMVGTDMLAVAIQSGLAGTKVDQLNQAWDSFMQNLTAGAGTMGEFQESIENIGQVAATAKENLGESGGLSLTVGQFAQSLKHFTGVGGQAWQNFVQIVGSTMPQLVDWFRTAEAEGATTGPVVAKSILDMAAEMIPFAKDSKTAQAMLLGFAQAQGLNIKTFPQLEQAVKNAHASVSDLTKNVDAATIGMSNMSQVAQNLGDVMNSALTSAISTATLKASGFYTATSALTNALAHNSAGSPAVIAAANRVTAAWNKAQGMAAQVAREAQNAQKQIDAMHGKNIDINVAITGSAGAQAAYWQGSGGGHAVGPGGVSYDTGGYLQPGYTLAYNGTGRPEPVGEKAGGDTHVHVYVDGSEVQHSIAQKTYDSNFANGSRLSGGRPTGILRPR